MNTYHAHVGEAECAAFFSSQAQSSARSINISVVKRPEPRMGQHFIYICHCFQDDKGKHNFLRVLLLLSHLRSHRESTNYTASRRKREAPQAVGSPSSFIVTPNANRLQTANSTRLPNYDVRAKACYLGQKQDIRKIDSQDVHAS